MWYLLYWAFAAYKVYEYTRNIDFLITCLRYLIRFYSAASYAGKMIASSVSSPPDEDWDDWVFCGHGDVGGGICFLSRWQVNEENNAISLFQCS